MEASLLRCRVKLVLAAFLLSFITTSSGISYYANVRCDNGEYVWSANFCDGRRDCSDGSDEKPANFSMYPDNPTSPYMSCERSQSSGKVKACALRRGDFCQQGFWCDNADFCDGPCPTRFQCPNFLCMKRSTVCDGDPCNDCPAFQHWNNGHGFKCVRNGRMCNLPQLFLWDGIADCDDKSDLCYSSENSDARDRRKFSKFNNSLCFQCANDPMIVSRSNVCDDVIDCPDMSDEMGCKGKSPSLCENDKCGVRSYKRQCDCFDKDGVCHNVIGNANVSCDLTKEESCVPFTSCYDKNIPCQNYCPAYFQCPGSTCWERSTVCDGDPCNDCPAFESRINAHGFKCVRNGRKCNLPQLFLWDGIADCDDKSDLCYSSENGDARDIRLASSFNNRLCFQCVNDPMVISRSSVCDGVIDCPDKSDECLCEVRNITGCGEASPVEILSGYDACLAMATYTYIYEYDIMGPPWTCLSESYVGTAVRLCDGRRDCPGKTVYNLNKYYVHDEDPRICTHRYICNTKYGHLNIPQSKVCDGFIDCVNGSDEYPEEKCKSKGRFYCLALNGAKASINNSEVCDLIINCDDQSDETNCTNDERFYCENKQPLFVKKRKVFNGIGDCDDWSDECPSKTKQSNENVFSSRYELIANPILRTVVWIMALLAVFGNLVVMATEAKTLMTTKSQNSAFRTNHLLVLNLSVSDLLMGVYLLMLGAVGARYSGSYCANDLGWRSSGGCTTMGVLVMLSSETSVLTMVLLTIFRLYAVINPFDASSKPELKTVILSIILSWVISFTIAFIPLTSQFQHFYETKAWMNDNPFFENVVVDFPKMQKFMRNFVTFRHNLTSNDTQVLNSAIMRVENAHSWMDYEDILKTYNFTDLFKMFGYFGYYSSNSVCISKLYVTLDDKAWAYSMGIITFNFFAFMFVAATYVWIYKKSATSARQVNERPGNERAAKQNKEMQKKIMRLIITDFFCWIPISIMAFVNLGGAPVPPVMYAVSAIILLPINSSLNPLIYSNAPKLLYDRIRDRLRDVCRRQPQEERQENVVVVDKRENLLSFEEETVL